MSEQKNDSKGEEITVIGKIGKVLSLVVDRFEVSIITISTMALAVLLIANVAARNIYRSIYFAEELAQFFVMIITFIGTSYAARKARHIRMGALLEAFPPKLEKAMMFVISAVSAIVMFYLAYISLQYLMNIRVRGTTTASLRMPYWYFIIAAPIGFFMAGFQYVRTFIKNIREKDIWQSPEQQSEYEDEESMIAEATKESESMLEQITMKESK